MSENYFKLLGLSFDPPESDIGIIRNAIENKKNEWSTKRSNSVDEHKYELLIKSIPDIEKVMLDPQARNNHANEIKKELYKDLDDTIASLSLKGYIESGEIHFLSNKFGFNEQTIKNRVKVEIRGKKQAKEKQEKPIIDRSLSNEIEENLINLNKESPDEPISNLYEFIALIAADESARNWSAEEISNFARATTQEYQRMGVASGKNTAIKHLCSLCARLFETEDKKKEYDNYLERKKLSQIFERIDSLAKASMSNLQNENVVLEFIKQLSELTSSNEEAIDEYRTYCAEKKYPIVLPSNQIIQQIKQCFICGVAVIPDKDQIKCTNCGNPLAISCPKCTTINDNNDNNCKKCGFSLKNMRLVKGLCDSAELSLERMDFEDAETKIKKASAFWPGNERVKELEKNFRAFSDKFEEKIKTLREKVTNKKYYAASAELKKIKQTIPSFSNPGIESEISDHITSAERLIQEAKNSADEATIVDRCSKAFLECTDHPEIINLLKKYPIAPPTSLSVTTDTINCSITLNWEKSPSHGTFLYRIVRKKDTLPRTPDDGELVQDEISCHFIDKKIEPGVNYFYSIFSNRAGIFSQPLSTTKGVMNYTEVSDMNVSSDNQKVTVNWKILKNIQSIGVWRKENGQPIKAEDGTPVGKVSNTGFIDVSVKNNITYGYIICVKYGDGKNAIWSPGIRFSATPIEPPKPLEIIKIIKINENTFEATWAPVPLGQVSFYLSRNPVPSIGTVISETELANQFIHIPFLSHTATSARFTLSDVVSNIIPVIKTSNSAFIGKPKQISKVNCISNLKWKLYNGKVVLEFNWPEKIDKVCCAYRNDRFPTGADDPEATIILSTKRQYESVNAILFRHNSGKKYYVSIFSIYSNNNEEIFSDAINKKIDALEKIEINYDISLSKNLLSPSYSCSIQIKCNRPGIQIPSMVLVGKERVIPLRKNDGQTLATIQSEKNSGDSKKYNVKLTGVTKNMITKLFFIHDDDYEKFSLIAPSASSLRVT